ncbi:uncharacterized protein F5891DRAFT_1254123 [Suillus fuscotomentosus]|uniref:Uncharacterized protein n=1 Tax=Suillus fuscotomentosus TaxID=1912939 RepID=A0AAD4HFX4_9AGAM|nr:uncharacterized protein F5891DRAFT_1254123 [Suillus fuscotomentosus]KAG1895108.1 hypothetical protein F5891DRAFT_1254123 [Suillus fuscotomentosus]
MDPAVVEKVLQLLDQKCDALCAAPCDVLGTSVEDIFLNLTAHQTGSVSLDSAERSISSSDMLTGDSLFARQAALPSLAGPTMMNLATNILYNRASNTSGDIEHPPNLIYASYAAFLHLASGTLVDLKWAAFFGAAMDRALISCLVWLSRSIMRFGGPILYLLVYGFVLFGILLWVD